MKYLDPKFSVDPPKQVTGCERCIYGRGEHAAWCPERQTAPERKVTGR